MNTKIAGFLSFVMLTAVLIGLTFNPASAATGNLVPNGNAETSDTTGWTMTYGMSLTNVEGGIGAYNNRGFMLQGMEALGAVSDQFAVTADEPFTASVDTMVVVDEYDHKTGASGRVQVSVRFFTDNDRRPYPYALVVDDHFSASTWCYFDPERNRRCTWHGYPKSGSIVGTVPHFATKADIFVQAVWTNFDPTIFLDFSIPYRYVPLAEFTVLFDNVDFEQ